MLGSLRSTPRPRPCPKPNLNPMKTLTSGRSLSPQPQPYPDPTPKANPNPNPNPNLNPDPSPNPNPNPNPNPSPKPNRTLARSPSSARPRAVSSPGSAFPWMVACTSSRSRGGWPTHTLPRARRTSSWFALSFGWVLNSRYSRRKRRGLHFSRDFTPKLEFATRARAEASNCQRSRLYVQPEHLDRYDVGLGKAKG